MKTSINISGRNIGLNSKPYVIAEISGNHDGKIENALKLIDIAKKSGADAVKIQTYTQDTITIDSNRKEFIIKGGLWDGYTLYDLYSEAHTPWSWHKELFRYSKDLGITLFSSFSDVSAVDFLEELGCPAYKIGSSEIVHIPLIKRAASTGKPLIIATGMATKEEVDEAVAAAKSSGCVEIILLHCTSAYPTPYSEVNLAMIETLASIYGCVVGLSDHTVDDTTSIMSIALGSSVIEKHIKLSETASSVDSEFSISPSQLSKLVENVNKSWLALGKPEFGVTKGESLFMKYRPSIYSACYIPKGKILSSDDLLIIRPANGLKPKYFDKIIGKTALSDISQGSPISWDVLSL